jgi:hypothetical protein
MIQGGVDIDRELLADFHRDRGIFTAGKDPVPHCGYPALSSSQKCSITAQ